MRAAAHFLTSLITVCSICGSSTNSARAEMLITEAEANRPLKQFVSKDVTRGPKVTVISPAPDGVIVKSPFNLSLKFESHGRTKVDIDSVRLIYDTIPPVDLTQRVKPFIKSDGIQMPNAEVPLGKHRIRVDVNDTAKPPHSATQYFAFEVVN